MLLRIVYELYRNYFYSVHVQSVVAPATGLTLLCWMLVFVMQVTCLIKYFYELSMSCVGSTFTLLCPKVGATGFTQLCWMFIFGSSLKPYSILSLCEFLFWNLHSKQPFLKQLIQTLNVALKIRNAYFHIFTKHLSVVFNSMGCICGRPSSDAPENPRHEEAEESHKQIQFQVHLYKLLQNGVLRKWCFEFKMSLCKWKGVLGSKFYYEVVGVGLQTMRVWSVFVSWL